MQPEVKQPEVIQPTTPTVVEVPNRISNYLHLLFSQPVEEESPVVTSVPKPTPVPTKPAPTKTSPANTNPNTTGSTTGTSTQNHQLWMEITEEPVNPMQVPGRKRFRKRW